MKSIEKFLYHAAAYTVAISVLFFIFALATGLDDASVSFGRYLLILSFGMLISAAELVFTVNKLHPMLKYLIHYAVLAIGFFVIFLSVRSSVGNSVFSAATVFAGIVIFSVIYAAIFGTVKLIKHFIGRTKGSKTGAQGASKKPSEYTPRFK